MPPTKIELIRRIACLADNHINTIFTEEMNIVGVAGSCGSGSKFIVASINSRTKKGTIHHGQPGFFYFVCACYDSLYFPGLCAGNFKTKRHFDHG
jgi:hypothetical protein